MIDLQTLKTLPARPEVALWPAVYEEIVSTAKKYNIPLTDVGTGNIQSVQDGFAVLVWQLGFGRSAAMRVSASIVEVRINSEWYSLPKVMASEDAVVTICPNCHIYDIDPNSKEGWCVKCTAFAPKAPSPLMVALLAASEKELAVRVAFNEATDKLLNDKSGKKISMKPIEDAKEEHLKALITLHHEVRDWVMGVKPTKQETGGDEVQS
jgi:hypothetical protein